MVTRMENYLLAGVLTKLNWTRLYRCCKGKKPNACRKNRIMLAAVPMDNTVMWVCAACNQYEPIRANEIKEAKKVVSSLFNQEWFADDVFRRG